MIDQESIKKIETKIKGIPLIDAAIFEVLSLLDNSETNFQQIVEKLSPEISAKFLKMANSAYYGRNVRNVEYAIRVLGFKAMKQILTTSTIIDHFATKADLKGFNFEKFQKHAQFCAAVSRVLGEMLGYEALEDLFTAAMLHNVGKLVIVVYLGDEYKEIEALKKSQGISSREAEKRVLGVTHAEIGGLALKQSNTSNDICNAISRHEADDRALLTGPPLRLELIIREASRIIDKFTLPKEVEPLEIIDLLQETIEHGKKLYKEGIKVQVLSKEHEHIFPKVVKEASELVYVELKETLEKRTDKDVDKPGATVDPVLRDGLLKRAGGGELPCAIAFDVAELLGISPDEVGKAADLLELRLVKCQLGLFGYRPRKSIVKPAASVPPELEKAILAGLIDDRLPCKTTWKIAKRLGIRKIKVSAACDAMGIKIRPCQLGAF